MSNSEFMFTIRHTEDVKKIMDTKSNKKPNQHVVAGVASMVGTTIEWYDFFLYGSAAALIFNKLFFPSIDPILGTLAAFGTYAVGFFARPFGGVVFGHFGDRVGRKKMLLISLIMMAIPTVLIGLLPTYESIGIWAAIILVIFRVFQGLAVGGEWGGAILLAVEHAPKDKKGFFGSLPQAGVAPGLLLSSFALYLVSLLPDEQLYSWGWRIPFLASFILLIVGVYIRLKVEETPDFEKIDQNKHQDGMPIVKILKNHRKNVLKIMGARIGEVTWFYTAATFSLAYATNTLGLAKTDILPAVMAGAAVSFITIPLAGLLSDKFGHRNVFLTGTVCLLIFAGFFFKMLATLDPTMIILAMVIAIGGVYALLYGPEGSLFSRQFPAEVRYSGISIGVQIAGAIGGGLAPIVATSLLALTDNTSPIYVVIYLMAVGALAFIGAYFMRDDY